ncbi:MAG TPA: helix-turn-helix domain-containing protein [Chthoniobacterales bacterium]
MGRGSEIQFASLGKRLALARETRGLSIEQVAKSTRIRPHLLRHLEGDDFTHFSHPSYLRLYFMDYARFLNVPLQEIRDWLPDAGCPGSENYEYITGLGAEGAGQIRKEYHYPRSKGGDFLRRTVRGVLVLAMLGLVTALALLIRDLVRIGPSGVSAGSAIAADAAIPAEPADLSTAGDSEFVRAESAEAKLGAGEMTGLSDPSAPSASPASVLEQPANLSLISPAVSAPAEAQIR